MSDDVVDTADVSMPEGIEVDEAAAYFGVFESSDALHQMMEMSREDAFERFFSLLSDLVLKPGDFDFEEASERLEHSDCTLPCYLVLVGVIFEALQVENVCDGRKVVQATRLVDVQVS